MFSFLFEWRINYVIWIYYEVVISFRMNITLLLLGSKSMCFECLWNVKICWFVLIFYNSLICVYSILKPSNYLIGHKMLKLWIRKCECVELLVDLGILFFRSLKNRTEWSQIICPSWVGFLKNHKTFYLKLLCTYGAQMIANNTYVFFTYKFGFLMT